jgi:FMN phosphatase YigB (HAD superfamily)
VFIDDLPGNIAAARACGWHAIQYHNFQDLEAHFKRLALI